MGHTTITPPQVVILKKDERGNTLVLLVKRADAGVWTIPGGAPEIGESLEEAAIREAREETGYEIILVRRVGVYSLPHLKMGKAFVFAGQVVGGKAAKSMETTDVRWFNYHKLPYTLLPFHRMRIEDTVRGKSTAAIEQLDTLQDILLHYIVTPWIFVRMLKFYLNLMRRRKNSL